MKITATKIFRFEMGHQLDSCVTEECKRPHGHGYSVEVTIARMQNETNLNNDGMVLDFKVLKEIISPIIKKYDHQFLTKETCGYNPTAENLALQIFDGIHSSKLLQESKCKLVKLKLWETDSANTEIIE